MKRSPVSLAFRQILRVLLLLVIYKINICNKNGVRKLYIAEAVILMGALYVFLKHTLVGSTIEAMAQNRDGASLVGISINRGETSELAKLIKKIQKAGITICLIEHKVQMVMDLAHRIMVLNYGTKIAEGTPKEISNNKQEKHILANHYRMYKLAHFLQYLHLRED